MKAFFAGFILSVALATAAGIGWNMVDIESAAFNSTPYVRL